MKQVISIAYAQENKNYDEIVEFNNEKVRLTQYSIGFDYELAQALIKKYDGICDVICISGVPPRIKTKNSFLNFKLVFIFSWFYNYYNKVTTNYGLRKN